MRRVMFDRVLPYGIACAMAFAVAGPARVLAADLPYRVAAPLAPAPLAPDWTGFYLGVHAGLIDSYARYDYATVFPGNLTNHTRIGSIGAGAPGLHGGFDYQFGSVVLGIEGDVTFTNGTFNLQGANFDFLRSSGALYTIGGRAGYLVTPDTLLFGKLGFSGIQLSGFDGFGNTFDRTVTGTQAGLGIEHMLTDKVSLRVDGSYTFGNEDLVLNSGFDHYRPSFLSVTAGLSYKIDPFAAAHATAPTYPNPLITHPPSWTSFYAGGLIGAGAGQLDRVDSTFGTIGPNNSLGFAGGALIGADYQINNRFVVGAALDTIFTDSTFDDDVGVGAGPLINRVGRIDRISALTGRLGVLVGPTLMVYGKGGPADIHLIPNQAYFAAINPAVATPARDMAAWQGGFGMETLVADHAALRLETLYTRANHSMTIDGLVPGQTSIRPSALTGTVGLVLKY
jgi:opacity protein-like surface antigen